MYWALIFAAGVLLASEAHSAMDAYEVDFPQPAATPIVAATCKGLDLPCRPDWATFVTKDFRPFKLAQSIFRYPKAPVHRANLFAFVEAPYIEHGEEDYDRLQQTVGQTGPSAERLWTHWNLNFSGAGFETQYRVVRAAVPSTKATDAIALCAVPVLDQKTAAPDLCVLLAFRSENRKFLLSSIGFEAGQDGASSVPRYMSDLKTGDGFGNHDAKKQILESRHALEKEFGSRIGKAIDKNGIFENAIATKRLDNFRNEEGNGSEVSYLILKKWNSQVRSGIAFQQTLQFRFSLETGSTWWAELADGTEDSGFELIGDKRDWGVALDWETRTTIGGPVSGQSGMQIHSFREPQAIGKDTVGDLRKAFISLMRDVCAPMSIQEQSDPASVLFGSVYVSCASK
ncbi:hypothetical protein ANOBCDAF_00368 [Pleomorphomonas sp. T1.2MG-36]|uniref:hypothetical protein n=1 Tax=Pleomorphomonas sp. T1.2MG-36 TaxID=3041167 RepID=UPI002477AEE1|nr:hypothetical protein [Pleomorphomonas sp. T1.2MG-36]CAI9399888.1 hypothetical protein ANOBCDAF_00368 [Pleomorphomonas sp. T1.2MG-36]